MNIFKKSTILKLNFQLVLACLSLIIAIPVGARDVSGINLVPRVSQSNRLAQSGDLVQVTGVKLNPTANGIEVVLATSAGNIPAPAAQTQGNSLYFDLPNAILALPNAKDFQVEQPAAGIVKVTVTQVTASYVRVLVTGINSVPTATLAITSSNVAQTPTEPELEINVIGSTNRGYKVPKAPTATKTDTPIRDIPQSIQVVPQQVLKDRNVNRATQAVETVSGVVDNGSLNGAPTGSRTIRGFQQDGSLRNGYRDAPNGFILESPIGNVEQVEVIKGPASVLFGGLEPGGVVNIATKQPLSNPAYTVGLGVGNYGFLQPNIDLTGPLNADKTLLYRFNASYQNANNIQDFVKTNQIGLAPSITWKIGDRTDLNVYYDYAKFAGNPPVSSGLTLSDGSLSPRNLFTSYPNFSDTDQTANRFGYTLTHKLNDEWQIRNNFAGLVANIDETQTYTTALQADRFATLESYDLDYGYKNYFGQIDILGKFKTGSLSHQFLAGFDINSFTDNYQGSSNTDLPILDIRNPNYNIPNISYSPFLEFENRVQSYGVYVQDRIAFSDNLQLLVGGRYDWTSSKFEVGQFGSLGNTTEEPVRTNGAFSPRIGLVYQPNQTVSLYTSYSSSFRPNTGFDSATNAFDPTKGTQYEIGVKADLFDRKLSTTLSAYSLTKTNVTTPDPTNPLFSVQTGEQRSQGIELDVAGEVSPGWKVIGSYALTNARVTQDNATPVGNRMPNVPENQFSLWTTYDIQTGNFKGLGFGLGLFYVGARQGDLTNTFQLKDYVRNDAAIYYKGDGYKAAINIRNLFNTDYASSTNGGRLSLNRGEPLTIAGSISWEF